MTRNHGKKRGMYIPKLQTFNLLKNMSLVHFNKITLQEFYFLRVKLGWVRISIDKWRRPKFMYSLNTL